jgi:hypothetical protein
MQKLSIYIETVFKLGIWNVIYVLWYRFTLKSGIRKHWFPIKNIEDDQDYFLSNDAIISSDFPQEWKKQIIEEADRIITGQFKYYSYHWNQIGNPPNWFLNPFNSKEFPNTNQHWTKLPDFSEEIGDIKNIWEASRFEWLITLSRAYSISRDAKYLVTINKWLKDWSKRNPLNIGPNWKCGQEASIRLITLVNANLITNQENNPTKELCNLIYYHLSRISANLLYSIAQDNNHGTSEAAALFIGGAYLQQINPMLYSKAKSYTLKGRKWLENRVDKLIAIDGSFSQHSVNYHRLMLDTLSFCEFWRKKLNQEEFSNLFYKKAESATLWLYNLTDNTTGKAVNLGANDGALLNNLGSINYRDFRSSLQLSSAIFLKNPLFEEGPWNESLWWFNIKRNTYNNAFKPINKVFASGYVRMNGSSSWSLIRFPYYKFRPSHNDVFHFDLWYKGKNILCDAGSYSYNPPVKERAIDMKSVKHHNTVCIDDNEQMPKLSRFLLGCWLKVHSISNIEIQPSGSITWEGSYFDNYNNNHKRKISVENNTWVVEDTIDGNFNSAVIGFNIDSLDCILKENKLNTQFGVFFLPEQSESSLTETYISEYYFNKRQITRLNIKISKPGKYKTIFNLN